MHLWYFGIRWKSLTVGAHVLILASMIFSCAFAADQARLMVYLDVPDSPVESRISLESATLVMESGSSSQLSLERDMLDSEVLAGSQVLLANSPLLPGRPSALNLKIKKIVGRVGVAEIIPNVPLDGLVIPLELDLQPGKTTVLFLTWHPSSIDPETEYHTPRFELNFPAIPPLGALVFATSSGSGSVMLIDRQTARVVGAIMVDDQPRGLAYAPAAQTLFVALADQDAVAVVDVLSLRVINIVPLQYGDDPTRLLLSGDGGSLFVLGPGSRTLTALSTWSQQQQFRLAVGEGPRSMVQDPVSGQVYVACEDEGRVQVVDPATARVVRSLTLASAPVEVTIDDQSRLLFLGGSAQRAIRTFDLATESGGVDQNICGTIAGLGINPRNRRLYASVPTCRNIAVVRPDLGIEYGSIRLPGSPGLLDFDKEFRNLWVVMPKKGLVGVCNVNRGRLEGVVEVGDQPYEVLIP